MIFMIFLSEIISLYAEIDTFLDLSQVAIASKLADSSIFLQVWFQDFSLKVKNSQNCEEKQFFESIDHFVFRPCWNLCLGAWGAKLIQRKENYNAMVKRKTGDISSVEKSFENFVYVELKLKPRNYGG